MFCCSPTDHGPEKSKFTWCSYPCSVHNIPIMTDCGTAWGRRTRLTYYTVSLNTTRALFHPHSPHSLDPKLQSCSLLPHLQLLHDASHLPNPILWWWLQSLSNQASYRRWQHLSGQPHLSTFTPPPPPLPPPTPSHALPFIIRMLFKSSKHTSLCGAICLSALLRWGQCSRPMMSPNSHLFHFIQISSMNHCVNTNTGNYTVHSLLSLANKFALPSNLQLFQFGTCREINLGIFFFFLSFSLVRIPEVSSSNVWLFTVSHF